MAAAEIIFEVREDETEGGYLSRALGYSIFADGEDPEEICHNVKEADGAAGRDGRAAWLNGFNRENF